MNSENESDNARSCTPYNDRRVSANGGYRMSTKRRVPRLGRRDQTRDALSESKLAGRYETKMIVPLDRKLTDSRKPVMSLKCQQYLLIIYTTYNDRKARQLYNNIHPWVGFLHTNEIFMEEP